MRSLNNARRLEFDSWSEFIRYSDEQPTDCDDRHSRTGEDEWCGASFDDAVKLGLYGWPDGVKQSRPYVESLVDKVGATLERFELEYDVEGQLVDIARYLDGEPECMIKFSPTLVQGTGYRHLKVVVNMCFSAGIPGEDVQRRGIAVAALIELLELSGHRVEVTVCHAVNQHGVPGTVVWQAYVRVKDFEDNLDLDRITYAVTHPSVLRRHLFAVQETVPDKVRLTMGVPQGGYGIPADPDEADQGDIYIPCVSSRGYEAHFGTVQKSIEWVTRHLKNQGVLVKEEGSYDNV